VAPPFRRATPSVRRFARGNYCAACLGPHIADWCRPQVRQVEGKYSLITFIHQLMRGDPRVPERFSKAQSFWEDYFADKREWTVAQFTGDLGTLTQTRFEHEVFNMDRGDAKTAMPYTALGSLYDEVSGFGDNLPLAERVILGFLASYVSLEVKAHARRAARLYSLDDNPKVAAKLGNGF
jgi:hypothetical protein